MRRTKIVCTIGPSCLDRNILEKMIESGMNVARLNFSHGTHEYHGEAIKLIKELRESLGVPLAIMLDTKGPEIRLGLFENGFVELENGDEFTLTTEQITGNKEKASVSYSGFCRSIDVNDRVMINDGKVILTVSEVRESEVVCTVTHGGRISDRKSVNLPGKHLDMEHLSEKDRSDILFGIENDIDIIAASFIRTRSDAYGIRSFLDKNGGKKIKLISKIENSEGIENFDDILSISDGIMVARGDMGVEIEYERLPGIQKRFIKKCYQMGKMVITATQMLESMVSSPSPTRAEITDVANAVFDGTSAIMLSGETAAGSFPIQAVQTMAKIAEKAESDMFETGLFKESAEYIDTTDTPNAVCDAACRAARDINAKAIISVTKYGQSARGISKYRPKQPIIAATPDKKSFNQLALSWGVTPVLTQYKKTSDDLIRHAVDCSKKTGLISSGDKIVVVSGLPLDTSGSTNLMKIEIVQ